MVELHRLVRPEWIFPQLQAGDRPDVLRQMTDRLVELGAVRGGDRVWAALMEREKLGSTAMGKGIAIPHCKVPGLKEVTVAIGCCQPGVDFEAEDGQIVRLVFLVLSPKRLPAAHLQALAAISRWAKEEGRVERILAQEDAASIHRLLESDGAA